MITQNQINPSPTSAFDPKPTALRELSFKGCIDKSGSFGAHNQNQDLDAQEVLFALNVDYLLLFIHFPLLP